MSTFNGPLNVKGAINHASVAAGTGTVTLTGVVNSSGALLNNGVVQEAQLVAPTLATIDQTAIYNVGRQYTTPNGDTYVYIQGIASVVAGDWVHYTITTTGASTTARAVANGVGPLGVAVGALIAGDFGWVQVSGLCLTAGAISGGGAAAGNAVYLTGTAGLVDDVVVVGDLVNGALFTVTESSAIAGVWLNYPSTSNASN